MQKSVLLFALLAIVALVVSLAAPISSVFAADPPIVYPPEYIGDKTPPKVNPDGSKVIPNTSPLSKEDQKLLDKKKDLAEKYQAMKEDKYDKATYKKEWEDFLVEVKEDKAKHTPSGLADFKTLASDKTLGVTQYPQINGYYCGPGTAYMMLNFLGNTTSYYGLGLSQSALGSTCSGSGCRDSRGNYLQTDYWGETPWSTTGTERPLKDGLNYWRQGSVSGFYLPVGTSVNAATLKNNLVQDIDANFPIAGNSWEVAFAASQHHLAGHPSNLTIYHWIVFRGYGESGNVVHYTDPAHNAPSVSWYASVPAYSSHGTNDMAVILDGRGYVW